MDEANEVKQLDIRREQLPSGWELVAVTGEIDLGTVGQLEDAIQSVLADEGKRLLVDLSSTSFMDSTGLRSLVMTGRDFASADRDFAVVVHPGPIARLVELSGVDGALRVVADRSEVLD